MANKKKQKQKKRLKKFHQSYKLFFAEVEKIPAKDLFRLNMILILITILLLK